MPHNKSEIAMATKKAIGTLQKVLVMIEDDIYCADIAHQVNASQGLLREINRKLLANHLKCCGKKALTSSDTAEVNAFVEELVRVWDVSTRK